MKVVIIFLICGAIIGLLRGEIGIGILAGAILVTMVVGVGGLCCLFDGRQRKTLLRDVRSWLGEH